MELELNKTITFFVICFSSMALMSCVSTQENQKPRNPKKSSIPIRAKASSLLQQSLETLVSGESLVGEIGNNRQIRITPLKTWKSKSNHYCRSYKEEILSKTNKNNSQKKGIACRDSDGRWKKIAK